MYKTNKKMYYRDVRKEDIKMHEFNEYIKWCKEKGYKPSDTNALQAYVAEHPKA